MTIAFVRNSGVSRVPTGFSWTTLLFGTLPSIGRRHTAFIFIVLASNAIGLFTTLFILNGTDGFLFTLARRIVVASVRNACLHQHLMKRGWIVGPAAQVIKFPANDDKFGVLNEQNR